MQELRNRFIREEPLEKQVKLKILLMERQKGSTLTEEEKAIVIGDIKRDIEMLEHFDATEEARAKAKQQKMEEDAKAQQQLEDDMSDVTKQARKEYEDGIDPTDEWSDAYNPDDKDPDDAWYNIDGVKVNGPIEGLTTIEPFDDGYAPGERDAIARELEKEVAVTKLEAAASNDKVYTIHLLNCFVALLGIHTKLEELEGEDFQLDGISKEDMEDMKHRLIVENKEKLAEFTTRTTTAMREWKKVDTTMNEVVKDVVMCHLGPKSEESWELHHQRMSDKERQQLKQLEGWRGR